MHTALVSRPSTRSVALPGATVPSPIVFVLHVPGTKWTASIDFAFHGGLEVPVGSREYQVLSWSGGRLQELVNPLTCLGLERGAIRLICRLELSHCVLGAAWKFCCSVLDVQ